VKGPESCEVLPERSTVLSGSGASDGLEAGAAPLSVPGGVKLSSGLPAVPVALLLRGAAFRRALVLFAPDDADPVPRRFALGLGSPSDPLSESSRPSLILNPHEVGQPTVIGANIFFPPLDQGAVLKAGVFRTEYDDELHIRPAQIRLGGRIVC